ncbi:metallophosphoesterase [candidate division KSB1 bacterium]|nr:metallophosphoesterase [candidate division KSB1 bacterium]
MKIALLSDSHDHLDVLHKAVDYCNKLNVAAVLHAGDLVAPFVQRALKNLRAPLTMVFGNNDGEKNGLRHVFQNQIFDPPYELELDGQKVLMLHDPIVLPALEKSEVYDLILYGHLHEIYIKKEKCLVVNPGELCGWLTGKSTFAIWDTKEHTAEIVEL